MRLFTINARFTFILPKAFSNSPIFNAFITISIDSSCSCSISQLSDLFSVLTSSVLSLKSSEKDCDLKCLFLIGVFGSVCGIFIEFSGLVFKEMKSRYFALYFFNKIIAFLLKIRILINNFYITQ